MYVKKAEESVESTTREAKTLSIWASLGALLLTVGLLYAFFQLQRLRQERATLGWTEVYFTTSLYRAEILREILEQKRDLKHNNRQKRQYLSMGRLCCVCLLISCRS